MSKRSWTLILFLVVTLLAFLLGLVAGGPLTSRYRVHQFLRALEALPEEDDSRVLALIGDVPITQQYLTVFFYDLSPGEQELYRTPEGQLALLNQVVEQRLLGLESRARGYHAEPKVAYHLAVQQDHTSDHLISRRLLDEAVNQVVVPEEEVRAYYESRLDAYYEEEEMRCLSLLISPGQEAQIYNRTADDAITPDEVEAKARRVQEALARGEDFATLAADLGEGLNAQNGGDTGFFKRGSMLQELEGALERMQPGEVSGAIDTKYGTYFLKLEKRRPGRQQPFEDVAPEIRQTLVKGREEQLRQRYQEFVAELKEKYGVIVYSDYAR